VTNSGHSPPAYSWPANRRAQDASDILLGCLLLLAAAVTIWDARELPFAHWYELNSKFFPGIVAVLLVVTAAVLLVRAVFFDRTPAPNWIGFSIVTIIIGVVVLAVLFLAPVPAVTELLLGFGPPEFAALIVCVLAVAIALSRRSRLRAAGMVLLGLLLAAVGLDAITGQLRMTMGFEQLLDGLELFIVAVGMIIVADTIVCLISPSLVLTSYGWFVPRWRDAAIGSVGATLMRVAAVTALVAGGYLAYTVNNRTWDVGLALVFGLFGLVSKLYGWNRLLLILALAYSPLLEQSIRQSMLLSQGDPAVFFRSPAGAILLSLAVIALATAGALSLRRRSARQPQ
jgi:TctA family transporter